MSTRVLKTTSESLTVDNDIIVSDTLEYTADQDFISLELRVLPRFYDVDEVKMIVWNELYETQEEEVCSTYQEDERLIIPYTINLQENNTYECWIKDMNDRLIWRGKLFISDFPDLQNFKFTEAKNNVYKI